MNNGSGADLTVGSMVEQSGTLVKVGDPVAFVGSPRAGGFLLSTLRSSRTYLKVRVRVVRVNTLPNAIEIIRPSVVQICLGPGKKCEPIGTGFIVHKSGYMLTARHVTEYARSLASDSEEFITIKLAHLNTEYNRANFNVVGCNIAREDERHDLALLEMTPNPFESGIDSGTTIDGKPVQVLLGVAKLESDRPRDGDSIAVSGYPLDIAVLVTTSGTIASAWEFDIDWVEVDPASRRTIPDVKDHYLADLTVNHGNSGGPVYSTESGTVIGVCTAFECAPVESGGPEIELGYNSGLSIVVPIRYGEDLLAEHLGKPYTLET